MPGKAEDEPVLTKDDVAAQPKGNSGGEGTPETAGRAGQTKAE